MMSPTKKSASFFFENSIATIIGLVAIAIITIATVEKCGGNGGAATDFEEEKQGEVLLEAATFDSAPFRGNAAGTVRGGEGDFAELFGGTAGKSAAGESDVDEEVQVRRVGGVHQQLLPTPVLPADFPPQQTVQLGLPVAVPGHHHRQNAAENTRQNSENHLRLPRRLQPAKLHRLLR